jgi:hypothetical protein
VRWWRRVHCFRLIRPFYRRTCMPNLYLSREDICRDKVIARGLSNGVANRRQVDLLVARLSAERSGLMAPRPAGPGGVIAQREVVHPPMQTPKPVYTKTVIPNPDPEWIMGPSGRSFNPRKGGGYGETLGD